MARRGLISLIGDGISQYADRMANGDFLAWALTLGGVALIVAAAMFFRFLDKKIDVSGKKYPAKSKGKR